MKTTELRTEPMYNPYFLENAVIEFIVFFDPSTGAEIGKTRWFTQSDYSASNNSVPQITLPFEVKRAKEVDLTRKTAFYKTTNPKNYAGRREVNLYIPSNLVTITQEKAVHQFDTDDASHYRDLFTVNLFCVTQEPCANEHGEYCRRNTEPAQRDVYFTGNYTEVKNEFGKLIYQVKNDLKAANIEVNRYDLERIMKLYTLTKKASE